MNSGGGEYMNVLVDAKPSACIPSRVNYVVCKLYLYFEKVI